MWLNCKIVSLESRSTDRSNFNDDKLENSDIRIPLKSSLFKAHRVPLVTARTDDWSGLLYLFDQCRQKLLLKEIVLWLPYLIARIHHGTYKQLTLTLVPQRMTTFQQYTDAEPYSPLSLHFPVISSTQLSSVIGRSFTRDKYYISKQAGYKYVSR